VNPTRPPVDAGPAERLRRAAAALPDGIGAFVTDSASDVLWLTGVRSTNAAVMVDRRGRVALATDARYLEAASAAAPGIERVAAPDPLVALVREAASVAAGDPVGVDAGRVPWRVLDGLTSESGLPLWSDSGNLVGVLRRTKDATEVDAIRQACALTDDAIEAVWAGLAPGDTEQQVAHRIVGLMLEAGADEPAYPPIVAFGENAAHPHHAPGRRALARGDLVLIDAGARVEGYCSDMTRTVALGDPGPQARRLHEAVVAAQAAGRREAVAGGRADAVHEAALTVLEAAGYGDDVRHRTGHGIGLDLHEAPILGAGTSDTLEASFTVTVEPGAYRPGFGGVRVEDLMLIGTDGAESLTRLPRDLQVL
jgi:Xaa-Pro aminopeptidase